MLKDCGQMRTLESLDEMRCNWVNESGDPKKAKDYGNVVNKPMFNDAPATHILDILPPPGLI